MSNSLANLLARMRTGSVVLGWGAVAAFGRAQLNRLLEEQYLSWLNESRFIPPMSGLLYVTPDQTESVQLDSLLLGKPVLSFASASLQRSRVTVTMHRAISARKEASASIFFLFVDDVGRDSVHHIDHRLDAIHHGGVGAFGGRGDQHLACAGCEMRGGLVAFGE